MRVGIGFDSHRFVEGRPLILGGVEVPHTHGLEGHSDADVLTHAVVDAILGALALGDIGTHFPDDDPRWKGASSRSFAEHAVGLAADLGYAVGNVDVTVVMELPKLSPHVEAMRRSLANALHVSLERVSIKATTAERMGALGRREGVACMAVAALLPREAG